MSALADELRTRSDAALVRLLRDRPDLATPAPSSVTALAVRAGSRPSVGRAVAGLDRYQLDVAEALVVLADPSSGRGAGSVAVPAVSRAIGEDAGDGVVRLRELALVLGDDDAVVPLPALADALGPYPAGLGPPSADLDGAGTGPDLSRLDPARLDRLLGSAPPGARRVVDALTWGPPIGAVDSGHLGEGVAWLLREGLLRSVSPTEAVLPREVGLAARSGRTHRDASRRPALPAAPLRPGEAVAAESVLAAGELVRKVADLLDLWEREPAAAVRAGGVGARELRRASASLGVESAHAAFVIELAGMAALVGPWTGVTGEREWVPTTLAREWREGGTGARWAALARSWLASARMPWLVGTRSDRGELRAALSPGLDRPWVPRLRARLLRGLGSWPPGAAPSVDQVHALLTWYAPRATPPEPTTAALLAEAAMLGLTGAGALSGAGRALLDQAVAGPAAEGSAAADPLAAALEHDLPPLVDGVLVQGDLTGVVAGRPTPGLEALLEACADVESRGAALTVRFSAGSVRRGLAAGLDAEAMLASLREHAVAPLPQPLEYLVRDAARTHAQLRLGAAASYLRCTDEAALSVLLADPRLAGLRLRALAPTVLVSPEPAAHVRDTLHHLDVAAGVEGPDGTLLDLDEHRRAGVPVTPPPQAGAVEPDEPSLAALVGRMRAGEEWAVVGPDAPTSTPARILDVLREAASTGTEVRLEVAGPSGALEQRRVRPLSVDIGRLRALDVTRESELTIAVHRIATAAPVRRPG